MTSIRKLATTIDTALTTIDTARESVIMRYSTDAHLGYREIFWRDFLPTLVFQILLWLFVGIVFGAFAGLPHGH